jgi:3-hydroxyisobutyrate dehydrogenase-like beta-hydroxyacid dehydrogenase
MHVIAVLGLGAMGSRIARRLLESGYEVVVWNRTPAKAAGFPRVAATPAEAASHADVTITMLANAQALRDVTRKIKTKALIEMSTVGPPAIAEVASRFPWMLDAPVLGSISEAEAGTLHIFAGGPRELYEEQLPLLRTLGTPHHVGPLGSGAAAKLVANSTLFGTLVTLGEAVRLADKLGLSREQTYEVLAATPTAAQAERRREALETDTFTPRFQLGLARKDADLVTEAAPELRLAQAARAYLAAADDASWGARDYSALLRWILDVADEQQDQRNDQNDEEPVADGNSADEREDDQQQDENPE